MSLKRITDNSIKAKTLKEFFDQIRMRDEDGQPLSFIEWEMFRIEFRRASLRRNHVESDVRIYEIKKS